MIKQRQLTPFGKRVVKKLVDMDRTQVWLCNELGITKSYLNRILHGERSGQKYLPKIYEILKFDEEDQRTA